jgi:oxygen-independent coproporphyrinogen-3 oxidase
MNSLGIYVQIPFCASKCSFCNFSSRVERTTLFDSYSLALEEEIEGLPEVYAAHRINRELLTLPMDTLYIGGGTPTLVGAARLEGIIRKLQARFAPCPELEFTLEVTPGSASANFLAQARRWGLNRLSVGAQTFDDRELQAVGRLHAARETRELVKLGQRLGIENISLDLIAGLPYQTRTSWRHTLETAARLEPRHISLYLFEIDEKSRLGREILGEGTRYHAAMVPGEAFVTDAYEEGREFLEREGYVQYEISNFAWPGFESRHNQKYWRLDPYLGLGAGAHSFDGQRRWANDADPYTYAERLARGASPIAELRLLSPQEEVEEFFFLGLRQRQGVDLCLAEQRWGADRIALWKERIEGLTAEGWLEQAGPTVRLPKRAYLVSNEIFQEFIYESSHR